MSEIVITSSPNGLITAYDTLSGTIIARYSGSRSPRHGLALVGSSYVAASHISSTTASASIHLYNWWSSSALHRLPVPEPVAPIASTPEGSFLFAGGLSGHVYAFSVHPGYLVRSLHVHRKPVSCLAISADSSLLISGGDDGVIATMAIYPLVEESNNSEKLVLHSFLAHDGPVTAIICCFGLCCPIIASCSTDCTCKLWSVLDGTIMKTVAFPCPIFGIALEPTGDVFYGAGSDGVIYKREGKKVEAWTKEHGGPVVSVAVMNEGKNLVSAAEDGSVYIWDVERGEVIRVLGSEMEGISDVKVARGIGDGKVRNMVGMNGYKSGGSVGLSGSELESRSVKVAAEMESELAVAAKDRRKAIDMLESAIGMHESLLKLIVKEAKRGDHLHQNNETKQSNRVANNHLEIN